MQASLDPHRHRLEAITSPGWAFHPTTDALPSVIDQVERSGDSVTARDGFAWSYM